MTQGSETTFSGPQNYFVYNFIILQSLFLAQVPSRPETSTEETGSPLRGPLRAEALGSLQDLHGDDAPTLLISEDRGVGRGE